MNCLSLHNYKKRYENNYIKIFVIKKVNKIDVLFSFYINEQIIFKILHIRLIHNYS